jgi:transposase
MFLVQSNAKKKARTRRAFTPEFKADIVARCRQGDRSIRQIAQDLI